jgi:hypothetical protein
MNICQEMDNTAPGGIYLCQVDEYVSCGACCGLYNVPDPSRPALADILDRRTTLFATVLRDVGAIETFGRQMTAEVVGERPFPEFHHCPFLGLLGPKRSRVGCLLHPLADGNNGADLRGLSFYGGLACRTYFCPSCSRVPQLIKDLVRRAAVDWYDYGLIITEADLLCAIFDLLQRKINNADGNLRLIDDEVCLQAGRKLIGLKSGWPFQPHPATDRTNYFFEDGLYEKPVMDYQNIAAVRSRHDDIFRNLVSVFHTAEQLHLAEAMVDTLINQLFSALFEPWM